MNSGRQLPLVHQLDAELENLHGHFSRDLEPVLRIASGDTVVYSIPDAGWGLEGYAPGCTERDLLIPGDEELNAGHCLIGPVYIEGAKPGMCLEVKVGPVLPGTWGWTWVGWPCDFSRRLGIVDGGPKLVRWELDPEKMIGRSESGHKVALHPFLGVMAVAPDQPGRFSTIEPYHGGGNLDCRDLSDGSSLFLPIEVEGALFSCGDGHARQGDGELCGTAVECSIQRAELAFELHDSIPFSQPGYPHISSAGYRRMPRARTGEGWMTFGLHETLDEAMHIAAEEMFELIQCMHGADRKTAAALASTAVDFRITQSVNSIKGVHAVLPHGAITK